jgi:diguanylate cyclase (GGDEF)-like protein
MVFWTVVLGVSLEWNLYQQQQTMIDTARVTARIAFEKDILYRSWNSGHGGVYVPVTEITKPNPYLIGIPDIVIEANNGKTYTLINPAYMTRQVFELQKESTGIIGHITSLNPIRPENFADDWEKLALESFNNGSSEISSVANIGNKPYLRLMKPLQVEENCLKCHAAQGYQVGDIRGGISESVPLNPLLDASSVQRNTLILGHGIIWLIGVLGTLVAINVLKQSTSQQQIAEENLVRMSRFDSLTGLYNRSYFEEMIRNIDEDKSSSITILSADLDNLKFANDSLGHSAGDKLLQGAAEVLKRSFRSADTIARIGGDEFVVILMGIEFDQIEKAISRVLSQQFEWNQNNPGLNLSISIGTASTSSQMNLRDALKLADERMYANKTENKAKIEAKKITKTE